ncbi:MAG TPA: dihydrodipicolinate synthase family protein [Candidatus Acidoferrum sp.]|nr:dihydrodipicolinate synthase family protein [Candidatus Acidoferrum sp.]
MREVLRRGLVIPACPLALNAKRHFDERRQRALLRYYIAAGAGGIAVGVHTTQFAIREPKHGLFEPVLKLAAEEMQRGESRRKNPIIRIGGICGRTRQAVREAQLLHACGYHAGLLSLAALRDATDDQLIEHCRAVGEIVPLIGFYLQPAAGGRVLPFSFWRRFVELENVIAIKIAPFNRYQTLDVVRAVVESGRDDIALYTGNDDNIVLDLVTPFRFRHNNLKIERRIVGGLLGHWAVWTRRAIELLKECQQAAHDETVSARLLRRAVEITDANAAFFDAANGFAGCIAGIHEVLRRQGLLEGIWCLDPREMLSPGQREEIDRVYRAYPHLNDASFVREHLDEWLSG